MMNHIDQLLEAIKEGTITIRHKDGSQWQLDAADKQMVSDALGKQIMKKPKVYNSAPHTRCPSCNSAIRVFIDDPHLHFCRWCGQAIDWSEEGTNETD